MNKNQIQKVQLIGIGKNILGTTDIDMKIGKMRKSQDFCVLPIKKGDEKIIIQSATRIGFVNKDGKGMITKSHPSGAGFIHLQLGDKFPFEFEKGDWEKVMGEIGLTNPEGDSSVVRIENDGAKEFVGY